MKKFIFILFCAFIFMSCGNFRDVSEISGKVGLPSHVSHIEFWNGGTKIREYDNCSLKLVIENNVHRTINIYKDDTKITYYTYIIKCNGIEERIIDSETLAIIYKE